MNRNFGHLNIYLNRLMEDIYPQPEDSGHTAWALDVFNKWFAPNDMGKSILDVGCGDTAFMRPLFERIGMEYTGVALKTQNPNVKNMDFSFMDFEEESFDVVFSRHSLEHSPMPIISLMEWYRVSKAFLCLILPNPAVFGWAGVNHYSVMNQEHAEYLLGRAGWHVVWTDFSDDHELRFMCEKVRRTYE